MRSLTRNFSHSNINDYSLSLISSYTDNSIGNFILLVISSLEGLNELLVEPLKSVGNVSHLFLCLYYVLVEILLWELLSTRRYIHPLRKHVFWLLADKAEDLFEIHLEHLLFVFLHKVEWSYENCFPPRGQEEIPQLKDVLAQSIVCLALQRVGKDCDEPGWWVIAGIYHLILNNGSKEIEKGLTFKCEWRVGM